MIGEKTSLATDLHPEVMLLVPLALVKGDER